MTQAEMKQAAEFIGHAPSTAAVELFDKFDEYVERTHADHPKIPKHVIWADVRDELTEQIKRAEG